MRTAERQHVYNKAEFIASISHESRLLTDPYILWWTSKGLYSPNHKCHVRGVVEEFDPGLTSPDSQAYLGLEEIISKNDSGTVFWFSPATSPSESHKIIATEIYTAKNGAKITYNYPVLFLQTELKPNDFVDAANRIAQYTKEVEIQDPGQRRGKPIFLNGTTIHWTHFMDIVLPNKEWEKIRTKEVWTTKRETLRAVSQGGEVYGEHPLSCPLTAVDVMFTFGEKANCPNCKKVVFVKVGQVCPGCKQVRPC
ncbi:MAG: hypothetical protein AAB599_00275 [Patescibacteria group bacterium]